MRKHHRILKIIFLLAIIVIGSFATIGVTPAGTVSVIISGDRVGSTEKWETGQGTVAWRATAYDDGNPLPLGGASNITWTSSDSRVVTVVNSNSNGNISTANLQAVGAGTTRIRATYTGQDADGNPVSISSEQEIIVGLKVTNAPNQVFEDGETYTVRTNSGNALTWTSDNENVVTVTAGSNGDGVLSFQGGGLANVTCRTQDNSQRETFQVVVNARFTEGSPILVLPYNSSYRLKTNARGQVYFSSDNTKVVNVNTSGVATAVSAGVTNIHVAAVDINSTWYDRIRISTLPVHVDFQIIGESRNIAVGDTVDLTTNINDEYKNSVNWYTSDTSIATVENGVVTAKKNGTVTIRASVVNYDLFGTGETQTSEITITVVDAFALSESEHTLNAGSTFTLNALATDNIAQVVWASEDEDIATVVADSKNPFTATVTGIAKGTTTITATQTINGISRTASCVVTVTIPIEGVDIYPEGELNLTIKQRYPLQVLFRPSNADNKNVIWASGDESVVTVDQEGWVTAVGPGTANVMVITQDGYKGAALKIVVSEPLTGVSLSAHSVEASLMAQTHQLVYTITPDSDGVNQDVTWFSSDPTVATVDEKGLVTFVSPGTAVITVRTKGSAEDSNGQFYNLIDQCTYTIRQPVTGVELDDSDVILKINEKYRLNVTVLPDNAANKKLIWKSTNEKVARVDSNGLVTAVGSGNCTITAQSDDSGIFDSCDIMVYQPVTDIRFSEDSYQLVETDRLYFGDAKSNLFTITPNTASAYTLTWKSDNPAVATIDEKGTCVGIKEGRTYITVTCVNTLTGETLKTQCVVNVTARITGISLNSRSKTIYKGKTFALQATVAPKGVNGYKIIWTSSDDSVAQVTDKGVVTGKKRGTAVITATIEENENIAATCIVTVREKVTGITITGSSHYINKGKMRTLKANVRPATANNKSVQWWSGNKKILTVNQSGRVKAVGKYGQSTYIYCKAKDGSGKTAKYKLRIVRPVTKVSVSPSRITLLEGETAQLKATIAPRNATVRSLTWTSSNPEVATVDEDGEITAVGEGTCKIYATSTDGNKKRGSCKVIVKRGVAATAIRMNSSSLTMLSGQSRTLSARIIPSNSTETYRWYSSDSSVATVSKKGVVTARGQGNAEIYAISTLSGVESTCTVTVLALNAGSIVLEQYDRYDLDVFGSTGTIRWYTGNRRVAVVSQSGIVTAKMAGTTTITAKVNGKVLSCKVRVVPVTKKKK